MLRAALLAATLPLAGCIVFTDGPDTAGNEPPALIGADAGCDPDSYYDDFVWWFEAQTTDPDGAAEVEEVWAEVYDATSGAWVDGFPLAAMGGGYWYSAWVGGSTYLDCTYADYEVDVTAEDVFGAQDTVTIVPSTW